MNDDERDYLLGFYADAVPPETLTPEQPCPLREVRGSLPPVTVVLLSMQDAIDDARAPSVARAATVLDAERIHGFRAGGRFYETWRASSGGVTVARVGNREAHDLLAPSAAAVLNLALREAHEARVAVADMRRERGRVLDRIADAKHAAGIASGHAAAARRDRDDLRRELRRVKAIAAEALFTVFSETGGVGNDEWPPPPVWHEAREALRQIGAPLDALSVDMTGLSHSEAAGALEQAHEALAEWVSALADEVHADE